MTTPTKRSSTLRMLLTSTGAALALMISATPVGAAGTDGVTPVIAGTSYWQGFVDYWVRAFGKQSGMVMFALGLGAVSVFIVTRGKWRK